MNRYSFVVDSTDVLVQDMGEFSTPKAGVRAYRITLDQDEIWTMSFYVDATSIDEAAMMAERQVSAFLQDNRPLSWSVGADGARYAPEVSS